MLAFPRCLMCGGRGCAACSVRLRRGVPRPFGNSSAARARTFEIFIFPTTESVMSMGSNHRRAGKSVAINRQCLSGKCSCTLCVLTPRRPSYDSEAPTCADASLTLIYFSGGWIVFGRIFLEFEFPRDPGRGTGSISHTLST